MPDGIQPIQATVELFDAFTAPMMSIINAANLGANAIAAMQNVVGANIDTAAIQQMSADIESARAAAERFQEALRRAEMPVSTAPAIPEPVQVPFEWQSANNIEVFNTSGAERWRQEIASAQEMMNQLSQSQQQITQSAVYGDILPPSAANDMIALNERLTAIQQRITRISSRPIDAVSAQDIAQTEQLRMQLNRCLQLQEQMNGAANSLDLEAANRAYLELEHTVGNTERFIRDNVSEQENFNSAVRRGQNEADKLTGFLKKAAGAFLSIKTVEKVVDISDQMTSINARLSMMNDGLQSNERLLDMTYAAAENARGSLTGMASVVARIGNNARDAFSSNAEVIAFSELIQKQMTIAGASAAESSNSILQLSQALGSGVLRGDELNSIFEQAPNIIQSIADYLDVPIGKIREMASDGEISAAVVKAAIMCEENVNKVNAQFNTMPKTWGQVWQSMQNRAIMAMQPVLDKVSEMANSEDVQNGVTVIIDLLAGAAEIAVELLGMVASAVGFVAENWSVIGPIVMAAAAAFVVYKGALVASKAAQIGFKFAQDLMNGSLLACPIFWVVAGLAAFVAVVGIATAAINKAYGLSLSFGGMIGGFLIGILAVLGNTVIGVANYFITGFDYMWNTVADFVNFFANVFKNPVGAVWNLWEGLITSVVESIKWVTDVIDNIFGTNWSEKLDGFKDKLVSMARDVYGEEMDKANITIMDKRSDRLDYIDLEDAFDTGYYFGDKLFGGENSFSAQENNSFDYSGVYSAIDDIAANTGDIKDSLEISEEELKYLRDIAEQEAVNRFTTAEITIEQTNNNTIAESWDIDGIVDSLTEAVGEAANIISEGAYDY